MNKKKRILTAQPKWLTGISENGTELRFGGMWLRQLGFEPGAKVEVLTIENQLIITPIKEA